ncbi:hypothetical protein BJY01DRAFT_109355 [Aspergillus pseudoustus]|uniref:Uncharacterized protein n=1 Tax=Aspergillus pseudoustus TaxID=1810923 RepID=A0ABR4KH27_9EURO
MSDIGQSSMRILNHVVTAPSLLCSFDRLFRLIRMQILQDKQRDENADEMSTSLVMAVSSDWLFPEMVRIRRAGLGQSWMHSKLHPLHSLEFSRQNSGSTAHNACHRPLTPCCIRESGFAPALWKFSDDGLTDSASPKTRDAADANVVLRAGWRSADGGLQHLAPGKLRGAEYSPRWTNRRACANQDSTLYHRADLSCHLTRCDSDVPVAPLKLRGSQNCCSRTWKTDLNDPLVEGQSHHHNVDCTMIGLAGQEYPYLILQDAALALRF